MFNPSNLTLATMLNNSASQLLKQSVFRLQSISRHISSSSARMSPLKNYDYLVIGGGSGGVASARRAAKYGAKVLLIEANFNKLGGTCVNVGCVPKKVMWYAADAAHKKHHLKSYGLSNGEGDLVEFGDFSWGTIKDKRDAYVTRLNGIYERNLKNEGVEYVFGRAKFINANGDVEVGLTGDQEIKFLEEGKTYKAGEKLTFSADKILIATGGAPIIPPDVPGAEYGITSDGFFELKKQPKTVAIVGAGYIGVELSGIFQSLGSETHLLIRGDTVLRSFDEMIQNTITDYYTDKLGVKIHKQFGSVKQVERTSNGNKLLTLGNGEKLEVEELIWTVGRKGEIDIGLDLVDVELDHGKIVVDEYQQTKNPKIFSLGDVVGKAELTPVAIAAGRRLSNRLFSGNEVFAKDKLDYNNIPSVIFSHPEAGSIGLSTAEAKKVYGEENVKVYNSKFTAMYYAMMDSDDLKSPTQYRIVCAGKDEKVVGLHIVGDSSAEILQGFGVAIKMGATKKDFDNCVAIHPTSAEELVTMT